ncbi:hypothetical protein JB92DRAFT_3011457 [Gautieria morchelliformis]|nr:hypothetical protein JB92DRAFT_3011457 [Gautieria morchelliformis]
MHAMRRGATSCTRWSPPPWDGGASCPAFLELSPPAPPTMKSPRRHSPVQAPASSIGPEIILLILSHLRHPLDTLPDPPHVLPTLRAVPLVCRAWHQPGTTVLYQRVVFSSESSRPAKLLIRSIRANPPLARFVTFLSFPDLGFEPCEYQRNERSAVRLRNYAVLVRMCPNLIFLRFPTNFYNAIAPGGVPALPLPAGQIRNLLSLNLTMDRMIPWYTPEVRALSCSPLAFLPIHTALPSLVNLTLSNFILTLDGRPALSRLLLPSLPALRSLTLSDGRIDARAAAQLFTTVRPSLRHLELSYFDSYPFLIDAAFLILGPVLESLVLGKFVYDYHITQDAPAMFPPLRTLTIAALQLSADELHRLPPSLEQLTITAPQAHRCIGCGKGAAWAEALGARAGMMHRRGPDMSFPLLVALGREDFPATRLRELVVAGRCCAWRDWGDLLKRRCATRGIRLVTDVDRHGGPEDYVDMRTPTRGRVDAIVRRTGALWKGVSERFSR